VILAHRKSVRGPVRGGASNGKKPERNGADELSLAEKVATVCSESGGKNIQLSPSEHMKTTGIALVFFKRGKKNLVFSQPQSDFQASRDHGDSA